MSLPGISVIIPCYNSLPFVLEAVASVLDQADDDVECLVVDDGSQDGSAAAVARKFGSRVGVIRQDNGGPAAARNRGFAEAGRELVCMLDSDDLLAERSLANRREAFAGEPELEMLVGQFETFAGTGLKEIVPQPAAADPFLTAGVLARQGFPHVDTLTFRRAVIQQGLRFDGRFRTAEDYDFWVRAWASLRWRLVAKVLARKREGDHDRATSRRGKLGMYQDQLGVLQKNRPLFHKVFGSDKAWQLAFGRWATDFALVNLLHGQRRSAFRWAAQAIQSLGRRAEKRAGYYVLEACLPPDLYAMLAWMKRRLSRSMPAGAPARAAFAVPEIKGAFAAKWPDVCQASKSLQTAAHST